MPPATTVTPLLIDTVILTHWRNGQMYVTRCLDSYVKSHHQYPALPSVAAFEALKGFKRMRTGELEPGQQDRFDHLQALIGTLDEVAFDTRGAQIAAEIFPSLARKDQRRLANDVFIAATALANGLGVATQNKSDFELIESLVPVRRGPFYIAVWK